MGKDYDVKEVLVLNLVDLCLNIERNTDNYVIFKFSSYGGYDVYVGAMQGKYEKGKEKFISVCININQEDFHEVYHQTMDKLIELLALNRKDEIK